MHRWLSSEAVSAAIILMKSWLKQAYSFAHPFGEVVISEHVEAVLYELGRNN